MQWFRNQKMAVKLTLGFGVTLVLLTFVGVMAIRDMAAMNALTGEMVEKHARGVMHIKDANISLVRTARTLRNAILDDTVQAKDGRKVEMERFRADFRKAMADFDAGLIRADVRQRSAEGQRMFEQFSAEQNKVWQLTRDGRDAEARAALKRLAAEVTAIETVFGDLEKTKREVMAGSLAQLEGTYVFARTTMIAIIAGCALLTAGLVWAIARAVSRPLGQAVEVLQHVAQADFSRTMTADTRDEFGELARATNAAITQMRDAVGNVREASQALADGNLTIVVRSDLPGELGVMAGALNQAVGKLRHAMAEVRETANAVASSSEQLAAASQEISSGAQEQASSLEETAASLEEMTATIKQNADNAQQASQLAGGARSAAEDGGQVVSEAVQAMGAINEASRKIADIITTIDEIAFQTNLLALNAAVEAARAGEQGRGFAVVAAEVRNLAQRSATAAKEIKDLISDSSRKVDAGSALVNASGKTLTEIVASVKRVTDIVAEIAAASREQASGIEQVNKAVTQMDQVTQANASQTEEMSGTSESLSGEAGKLQGLVRRFDLGADLADEPAARPATRKPVAMLPRKAAVATRRAQPSTAGTAALALDSEFQEF